MNEPCCAHSKIIHKTIKDLHGICTDKYYCLTCNTEFIIKPKKKPMSEDEWQDFVKKLYKEKQMENKNIVDTMFGGVIKMENRVIFESKYQARTILKDILGIEFREDFLDEIVKKGYIRKSSVEKAEEMYKEIIPTMKPVTYPEIVVLCNKMHEAIQELKSEIERLKK